MKPTSARHHQSKGAISLPHSSPRRAIPGALLERSGRHNELSLQSNRGARREGHTKIPCLQAEFRSVSSLPLSGCLWLLGQCLLCAQARIFLPHPTVNISVLFLEEPYQTCPKTSQRICRPDPVSPCSRSAAGCTRGHVCAGQRDAAGDREPGVPHTCLRQARLRTPALNPPPRPTQAHHRVSCQGFPHKC